MRKNAFLKGKVKKGPEEEDYRYEVGALQKYIHDLYAEGVREAAVMCKDDLDKQKNPRSLISPEETGGEIT